MGTPRFHSGFTLIEMLVATAMVAVLTGSLYASLHVAFKARDSATRTLDPIRRCDTAINLIEADLQSALLPNDTSVTFKLAGPFEGLSQKDSYGNEGDDLTFFSATNDVTPDTGVGDVREVEFACVPSPQTGDNLLVRRLRTNLLSPQQTDPKEETICRGVRSFNIDYFDGANWQDTWDSTAQGNTLPVAAEVTLELNNPNDRTRNSPGYTVSRVLLIPCGQPVANTTVTTPSQGTR